MEQPTRQDRRVRLVTALLVCSLPFTLVACSSGSDATTDRSTAAHGVGSRWGECMRQAGFDLEDPDDSMIEQGTYTTPSGTDAERFESAARDCLQEVGVEPAGTSDKERWNREYRRVESCIRERGYDDFPEQPEGTIGAQDYPRAEEPGFQETFETCLREFSPDTKTQSAP